MRILYDGQGISAKSDHNTRIKVYLDSCFFPQCKLNISLLLHVLSKNQPEPDNCFLSWHATNQAQFDIFPAKEFPVRRAQISKEIFKKDLKNLRNTYCNISTTRPRSTRKSLNCATDKQEDKITKLQLFSEDPCRVKIHLSNKVHYLSVFFCLLLQNI